MLQNVTLETLFYNELLEGFSGDNVVEKTLSRSFVSFLQPVDVKIASSPESVFGCREYALLLNETVVYRDLILDKIKRFESLSDTKKVKYYRSMLRIFLEVRNKAYDIIKKQKLEAIGKQRFPMIQTKKITAEVYAQEGREVLWCYIFGEPFPTILPSREEDPEAFDQARAKIIDFIRNEKAVGFIRLGLRRTFTNKRFFDSHIDYAIFVFRHFDIAEAVEDLKKEFEWDQEVVCVRNFFTATKSPKHSKEAEIEGEGSGILCQYPLLQNLDPSEFPEKETAEYKNLRTEIIDFIRNEKVAGFIKLGLMGAFTNKRFFVSYIDYAIVVFRHFDIAEAVEDLKKEFEWGQEVICVRNFFTATKSLKHSKEAEIEGERSGILCQYPLLQNLDPAQFPEKETVEYKNLRIEIIRFIRKEKKRGFVRLGLMGAFTDNRFFDSYIDYAIAVFEYFDVHYYEIKLPISLLEARFETPQVLEKKSVILEFFQQNTLTPEVVHQKYRSKILEFGETNFTAQRIRRYIFIQFMQTQDKKERMQIFMDFFLDGFPGMPHSIEPPGPFGFFDYMEQQFNMESLSLIDGIEHFAYICFLLEEDIEQFDLYRLMKKVTHYFICQKKLGNTNTNDKDLSTTNREIEDPSSMVDLEMLMYVLGEEAITSIDRYLALSKKKNRVPKEEEELQQTETQIKRIIQLNFGEY